MSRVVLDSSMTMSWCFEDEVTPESLSTLDAVRHGEALVPSVWRIEVANYLLVAERRNRVSATKSTAFVAEISALPIEVEPDDVRRTFEAVLPLARETGLSSYDASYLELAMRAGVPLASLDRPLRRAARERGVALIPPD